MNIPSIPVQTKPFLWGAAAGALVLAIAGFGWGGWVTSTAAEKLAQDRTEAAVVAALTPVCVDQFRNSANASANLAALKEFDRSWDQRDYVSEGGWATMPGSTAEPSRELAATCAEELDTLVLSQTEGNAGG